MTAPHICDPDPSPRSAWWERLAAIFARWRR